MMDETKVQIGDDILLDIGTHSDWYISVICYNNESVNVELRRKIDRNNQWWVAEQIESQIGQPCDGCEYKKPYIEYKCTHHSCKFEDEATGDNLSPFDKGINVLGKDES